MEHWKPIKDFEELYEVSSWGRVRTKYVLRRASSNILKPFLASNSGGCKYYQYSLHAGDGKRVRVLAQVLVARHFVPNPDNLPLVNHKDLNKLNNIDTNLEWVTHQGNTLHARDAGVYNAKTNPKRIKKLTEDQVSLIKYQVEQGRRRREVAREFGVHRSYVDMLVRGERRV